ncbi:acyltransferase family protein [Microbacterium caowuchunii]|uniref:acyltransferase family protein n=1 Tax=Microbacterium caowuchunii TaxID=2614638 RepID=UPI00177ED1C0|nr:acyltransferase family protein [Microbacterium caowuchunii]
MSERLAAPLVPARTRSTRFRTDIQALRALAIGAVLVNHLWPTRLPGGYVGVDVFFVISGFLITSHLFGEVARTGRVRLGAFYARRIRRLLPAALLVLSASAVLVALFLPYPRWERNAMEIAASAAYVENWFLASMSVNYSALNDSASVAQHYWSLSVEEQFYLIWPVLMLAAVFLGARFSRASSARRRVLVALVIVGVLSFASSLLFTDASPNQAYFVTFTRAWEFAAGALVALTTHRLVLSRGWANATTALGSAAILVVLFAFDDQTPFPGAAALVPVIATAAIIAAGRTDRLWHTPLTASAPVQWLGGVSYSLYLWHWPLIVIAPFVVMAEASTAMKIGILVVSLLLAWGTKTLVEDPGQRWRMWSMSVRRAVGGMIAGIAIVAVAAGGLWAGSSAQASADSLAAPLPTGSCVGPDAMLDPATCGDRFGPAESVVMTRKNEYFATPPECGPHLDILAYGDKRTTVECDFSGGAVDATEVWLVGDSHAQQWQGAILDIARENGWKLTTSYYGGCPAADVAFRGFRTEWGQADIDGCIRWSRDLSDAIVAAGPALVFTSMAARHHLVDDGSGRSHADQMADGLVADWTRWTESGTEVVVIADSPFNGEVRDPDCVLLHAADPVACAVPRSEAQPADPLVLAVGRADDPRIRSVDLTDRFCDGELCYAVIGGVPVYYDADHLNLQYVRMLAPAIGEAWARGPSQ